VDRFVTHTGADKAVNRDNLEAKACALAGFKAYITKMVDPLTRVRDRCPGEPGGQSTGATKPKGNQISHTQPSRPANKQMTCPPRRVGTFRWPPAGTTNWPLTRARLGVAVLP